VTLSPAWWFGAAVAVWWAVRAAIARREERNFAGVYPRNADGIIAGAEPIFLRGTRPGAVLLLHGFNDSPQSMASTAAAFHARGWSVSVPLLPGHGRRLEDWAASSATDWERAARSELASLHATHADVAVGGLSMGGALAFMLAAEQPDVRAVVAFAPYLHASVPVGLLRVIAPIASIGARYLSSGGASSVHDPIAANAMIAYRRSTPSLVVELEKIVMHARAGLPHVHQPVLVVQSREDNRIPAASAQSAFDMIGSADKTLHWTTGNGHVVTVDYGHTELERLAADWLEGKLS
jgi:carboxylesterase